MDDFLKVSPNHSITTSCCQVLVTSATRRRAPVLITFCSSSSLVGGGGRPFLSICNSHIRCRPGLFPKHLKAVKSPPTNTSLIPSCPAWSPTEAHTASLVPEAHMWRALCWDGATAGVTAQGPGPYRVCFSAKEQIQTQRRG